jgi:hypothetical protein
MVVATTLLQRFLKLLANPGWLVCTTSTLWWIHGLWESFRFDCKRMLLDDSSPLIKVANCRITGSLALTTAYTDLWGRLKPIRSIQWQQLQEALKRLKRGSPAFSKH